MTDAQATPRTFSENVTATGKAGDSPQFFVGSDRTRQPGRSSLPAVSFGVYLSSASVHTYLTADEAALLGKTLLDAARFAHTVEDLHVLADALVPDGEAS